MNKVLIFTAVAVLAMGTAVQADPTSNAVAHIYATVDPNVAVAAPSAAVDAGAYQTGTVTGTITFRVDANTQAVSLQVCASDLWKGDDPTGTDVDPIALDATAGATILPTNANPIGGASNNGPFTTAGTPVEGFPTQCADPISFESSQNNHFSQDVTVTVQWDQTDPEKPQGEYSGVVQLIAVVLPVG